MPHITFRRQKLHTQSLYTAVGSFLFHCATDHLNQVSASLLNCLDFKQMNTNENQCTLAIFTYIFC